MYRVGFVVIATVFLAASVGSVGILNNSTTDLTAEDSVSVVFYNLDSLGQNVGGLDTTLVLVRNGGGDSVFAETVAGLVGRVRRHVGGGDTSYCWVAQVADIDGSGEPGSYSVHVTALSDQTGGWLRTSCVRYFQLVGWELDDLGDSTGLATRQGDMALDSLGLTLARLQDALDSVYAVLDTLQAGFGSQAVHAVNVAEISGDAAVANSLEAILDGTGGGSLTLSRVDIFPMSGPGLRIVSNDTGMAVYGAGGAPGVFVEGGSSGHDMVGDLHGSVDTVLHGIDSVALVDADKQRLAGTTADSVLADSVHYQGEGAAVDSTKVARWVWNTPQTNHGQTGTFGDYLDADISGVSSGSGVYSVTVVVIDSSSQQPVPHVDLTVRNLEQTSLVAVGCSDGDGLAGFNLDADSFVVIARAAGYLFGGCDTLAVTAAVLDTVCGCAFDPGEPSSPSLCRVYGYLYNLRGEPEADAEVTAWLPAGVARSGAVMVSPLPVASSTDSTGYFHLDLVPSTLLAPAGARYEITVNTSGGTILRRRLEVPDQTAWQFTW